MTTATLTRAAPWLAGYKTALGLPGALPKDAFPDGEHTDYGFLGDWDSGHERGLKVLKGLLPPAFAEGAA